VKENKALLITTKETGLKVNADKTKYLVMSRDQNAGQSHYIKENNCSFERVEDFKHLGTALMNQNSIQEEIKSRMKSGNACYNSVHNLLPSSLLSKNTKIKIYRIIMLPVAWYGYETWSLTMREECRLRVFENRVLRRIFGPKRDEVTGEWRKLNNKECNDLYCSANSLWVIKSRRMRWAGHVARMVAWRGEVHTRFWWGNLMERDHLKTQA